MGEGTYAVGGGGFVAGNGGVDFALGVGDGVWVARGHFWRSWRLVCLDVVVEVRRLEVV